MFKEHPSGNNPGVAVFSQLSHFQVGNRKESINVNHDLFTEKAAPV
jgi:hypothetical protein